MFGVEDCKTRLSMISRRCCIFLLVGLFYIMPGNRTRKQHYLPRCYLKRFTTEGEVCMYTVRSEHPLSKNPVMKGIGGLCQIFYFYEDPSREFNQVEDELYEMEDKVSKLLDDVFERGMFLQEDVNDIMLFAGQLHVRSPCFRHSCMCHYLCLDDDRVPDDIIDFEAAIRKLHNDMFRVANVMLLDHPYAYYRARVIRFKRDCLVTSDNPVVPCNLCDLCDEPWNDPLDGFILPLSPSVLLIAYHTKDESRFSARYPENKSKINAGNVNQIMVENAITLVFSNGVDNPFLNYIERIPLNPFMEPVYEYLQWEMKNSEKLWKSWSQDEIDSDKQGSSARHSS